MPDAKNLLKIGVNLAILGAVVVVGSRFIEKLARKVPG
jgi:hypothetical protein